MVVRRRKGPPQKRGECWSLTADPPGTARRLCELHGRRMTIGQWFRGDKSQRNGRSPREAKITRPDRPDRLLPAPAIACLPLCGVGLPAGRQRKPSAWCPTNRDLECGLFTIGPIMPEGTRASPAAAAAAVAELSESVAPNWG